MPRIPNQQGCLASCWNGVAYMMKGVQSGINALTSLVKQEAAAVFATATCTVLSMAWRDRSLGKITGGLSMAAGGGYLVAKSGLIPTLFKKVLGIPPSRTDKVRYSYAAVGGTALVAGLGVAATGAMELWQRVFGTNIQRPYDPDPKVSDDDLSEVSNMVEKLRSCDKTDALLKKFAPRGINLRLAPNGDDAKWIPESDKLIVSGETKDDRMLYTLDGICGASDTSSETATEQRALRGQLSFSDYSRQMREARERSKNCVRDVGTACADIFHIPQHIASFTSPGTHPLEEQWYNGKYKDFWKEYAKKPYCAQHPEATDCAKIKV